MNLLHYLIPVSEWLCLKLFGREHMTLSALAQEDALMQDEEYSIFTWFINLLFWFDPNHCHNAFVYYHYMRRQRLRGE